MFDVNAMLVVACLILHRVALHCFALICTALIAIVRIARCFAFALLRAVWGNLTFL